MKEAIDYLISTVFTPEVNTVLITIISGVGVFVLGEVLRDIWITPLQEYKKLRQKVSYELSYCACYYSNVIELAKIDEKTKSEYSEISKRLRILSCEVRAYIETLSFIKIGIPKKKVLLEISKKLMYLSNSLFCPYNTNDTYDQSKRNGNLAQAIIKDFKMYNGDK